MYKFLKIVRRILRLAVIFYAPQEQLTKTALFVSDTLKNTSGVSEVFYIGKYEFYALQ